MKTLVPVLCFCVTSFASGLQDVTQPPPEAHVLHSALGVGVQVYICQASAADFRWTLLEPKADLVDAATKQVVGTHIKGPTWTWNDRSSVVGTVLQQRPSPGTVPWLLLAGHSVGSQGSLSDVAYIRRSDTQGGVPAATALCNADSAHTRLEVPYKATYTFYTMQAAVHPGKAQ
ncbi:MAG: DUF3455 domain-containing protein [Janthinobacterium lividum]